MRFSLIRGKNHSTAGLIGTGLCPNLGRRKRPRAPTPMIQRGSSAPAGFLKTDINDQCDERHQVVWADSVLSVDTICFPRVQLPEEPETANGSSPGVSLRSFSMSSVCKGVRVAQGSSDSSEREREVEATAFFAAVSQKLLVSAVGTLRDRNKLLGE